MREYQANSHKSKEMKAEGAAREKRVEKVVSGSVSTRDNKARKLTDMFISEDATNVKSYILMDIIVPVIKNTICDIIINTTNMIFGGGSGRGGEGRRAASKVSYRSYYEDRRDTRDYDGRGYRGSRFEYEDIEFESRYDAENVRRQMVDTIDRYGFVTVADMYDMAGLTAPYTSNDYGWVNIRSAEPVRVRNGKYILRLPKASPID